MRRLNFVANAAATLALALTLAGCHSLKLNTRGLSPDHVQMTAPKDARVAEHFKTEATVWYLLGGLVPLGEVDLTKLLEPHLQGDQRVANLTVYSDSWFDIWLVSMTRVQVEGDVIVPR